MQVAVVGHVEWVEFLRVDEMPERGEIVHALETWEEAAGGGAVAAVQLARLTGTCAFYTALGDDDKFDPRAGGRDALNPRVPANERPLYHHLFDEQPGHRSGIGWKTYRCW